MNCLFCKIVQKQIDSQIVFEDDTVIAFNDMNPQAPVHLLVVPKRHMLNILDADGNADLDHIFSVIANLARSTGIVEKGFRIVNNSGSDGGQTIDHVHFHLLGGRPMKWPPG